jgi:hypothetical protein
MKPDRSRLIRLAHSMPALRSDLLPLIQKLGAAKGRIDIDVMPETGMNLVVQDNGEPFEGNRPGLTEMLYWVETEDGLGEGSLIVQGPSVSLSRNDRVQIGKSKARKAGRSYVGEVEFRKF